MKLFGCYTFGNIDFGIENTFFLASLFAHSSTVGIRDQRNAAGTCFQNLSCLQNRVSRKSNMAWSMNPEATMLKTLASKECATGSQANCVSKIIGAFARFVRRPNRRIGGNVNLLAFGHHRVPSQGIDLHHRSTCQLAHNWYHRPAGQHHLRVPTTVSHWRVRHDLAVVIQDRSICTHQNIAVVDTPDAAPCFLVETDGHEDSFLSGRNLAKLTAISGPSTSSELAARRQNRS